MLKQLIICIFDTVIEQIITTRRIYNMGQKKKKLSLMSKIGIGFVLGIVLGFFIGPISDAPFVADILLPTL